MSSLPLPFIVSCLMASNHAMGTQFKTHIICDDVNHCKHQRLVSGVECSIDCQAALSCGSSEMLFSANCDMANLDCGAWHSCFDAKIECSEGVHCEVNAGYHAIKETVFKCKSEAECLFYCNDIESCSWSDFHCEDQSDCLIDCSDNDQSCDHLAVFGHHANSVEIICRGDSCGNLKLYCPRDRDRVLNKNMMNIPHDTQGNPSCSLELYGNGSKAIEIYAVNGMDDVTIINHQNIEQDIQLLCNTDYSSECDVDIVSLSLSNTLESERESISFSDPNGVIPHIKEDTNLVNGTNFFDMTNNKLPVRQWTGFHGWLNHDVWNMVLFIVAISSLAMILIICLLCAIRLDDTHHHKDKDNHYDNVHHVMLNKEDGEPSYSNVRHPFIVSESDGNDMSHLIDDDVDDDNKMTEIEDNLCSDLSELDVIGRSVSINH